jgi:hypothetical protein
MSNFWAYLKTRQFRNTILLVVATVIGIVLIAFFSLSSYTRHGQGIPVPTLKGLNVDKAMQLLKEQGLNYKIDSVYVPDQTPPAPLWSKTLMPAQTLKRTVPYT